MVRGKKREIGEVARMGPAMFGDTDVMKCPGQESAGVSEDQYGPPVVTIINRLEDPFDLDLGTEFFKNFTHQGLLRALCGVDLATGELPQTRVAFVVRASGDQDFLAVEDDGRSDQQRHFQIF